MPKRKTRKLKRWPIFPLAALALIVGLGYLGYYWFFNPQEVPIYQATGGGTVNLKLEPASSAIAANTTTTLTLTIDSGSSKVSAVQAVLAYSSKCLTPITITKGNFLTTVLADPQVGNGLIEFTYAAPPASGGKQGTGTLATITTGPTTDTCLISFTNNTQVAAVGLSGNTLDKATDAAIQILGSNPNPSPSPAISPSPTPAPKKTPKICSNDKYRHTLILKFPDLACKTCGVCD